MSASGVIGKARLVTLVRRAPAVLGSRLSDPAATETPALILDAECVEHNCKELRERVLAAGVGKVTIRPHVKSHKCPRLAVRQLELCGDVAQGVCAQKTCEAEAMAAGGIRDILLSNQVVSPLALRRLAALVRDGCDITVVVDHEAQVRLAAEAVAAEAPGCRLGVLVEVDVGQRRCGVATVDEAADLGAAVAASPGLELRGVQCYQGAAQHIRTEEGRREAVAGVADVARRCVEAFAARGLPCGVVTGGGSGTYELEAASGVFTEVQPGSAVVWDRDYSDNLSADGARAGDRVFRHALRVLATVISRCTALPSPRVVLDCGLKSMSGESGLPSLVSVMAGPGGASAGAGAVGIKVVVLSDEHTQLEMDLDHPDVAAAVAARRDGGEDEATAVAAVAAERLPSVGSRMQLAPGHCDPTCNLHDFVLWSRDGVVEEVMEVSARSPGL